MIAKRQTLNDKFLHRFRELGYELDTANGVKQWKKDKGYPLSADNFSNFISPVRRTTTPPIETIVVMAYCLDYSAKEIKEIIKDEIGKGTDDKIRIFTRLLSECNLTKEEQEFIEILRKTKEENPAKHKVLVNMIKL